MYIHITVQYLNRFPAPSKCSAPPMASRYNSTIITRTVTRHSVRQCVRKPTKCLSKLPIYIARVLEYLLQPDSQTLERESNFSSRFVPLFSDSVFGSDGVWLVGWLGGSVERGRVVTSFQLETTFNSHTEVRRTV